MAVRRRKRKYKGFERPWAVIIAEDGSVHTVPTTLIDPAHQLTADCPCEPILDISEEGDVWKHNRVTWAQTQTKRWPMSSEYRHVKTHKEYLSEKQKKNRLKK